MSRAVIYTWLWESCANDVVKLKEQRAKFLVLRLIALHMKYVMLEVILSMLSWTGMIHLQVKKIEKLNTTCSL